MTTKKSIASSKLEIESYINPANIYLLKVKKRNIRKRCEIRSKLTLKLQEQRHSKIKTIEQRQLRCSGVFLVNFEDTSHLFLVSLLLTLNR